MTQQIPNVLHDPAEPNEAHLNLPDGDTLAVGSHAWFDWLESNPSFHFDSGDLSFTARKHKRASGNFWYGYRKLGKQLGTAYLGKSESVTLAKMLEVASGLATPKPKKESGSDSYANSCITEIEDKLDRGRFYQWLEAENQRLLADQAQSDTALAELRSQLAEERAKIGKIEESLRERDATIAELRQQVANQVDAGVGRSNLPLCPKGCQSPLYPTTVVRHQSSASVDEFWCVVCGLRWPASSFGAPATAIAGQDAQAAIKSRRSKRAAEASKTPEQFGLGTKVRVYRPGNENFNQVGLIQTIEEDHKGRLTYGVNFEGMVPGAVLRYPASALKRVAASRRKATTKA